MICVVTVACLLSDNCWEMLWDRTLGAQSLIRVIDTLIYSLMGEILNQLQKFKQTKTLPFIRMFTSINWCKNLWIESLCCSWFMLVQFSITDSILYNIYIYTNFVCFIDLVPCPKHPIFSRRKKTRQSLDNSGRRKHCRVLLGDRIVTPRWRSMMNLPKPKPETYHENPVENPMGSWLPKRRV